jgi:hypothetical protein
MAKQCRSRGGRRWDVNDALRVSARFADWLSTGDARRVSEAHVWGPIRGGLESPHDDVSLLAAESNAALAAAIRTTPPIWCDPAMVDLLAAATAELPPENLEVSPGDFEPWYLPHPHAGIVVFAKPLPADWNTAPLGVSQPGSTITTRSSRSPGRPPTPRSSPPGMRSR